VRVLADFRSADGVKDAIGATAYPASVLYAPREWIDAHRDTAQRLARAMTRTLQWMHGHTPGEIASRAPQAFRGQDEALYVEAIKNSMPMFSPDGVMDANGPRAVRTLLAGSMEKVRNASIDLSKTYTNDFIPGR
jgi:sulfonate transport system substrate-binding protein